MYDVYAQTNAKYKTYELTMDSKAGLINKTDEKFMLYKRIKLMVRIHFRTL